MAERSEVMDKQTNAAAISYYPLVKVYLKNDLDNPIVMNPTFVIKEDDNEDGDALDIVTNMIRKQMNWKDVVAFRESKGDYDSVVGIRSKEIAYFTVEDTRFS